MRCVGTLTVTSADTSASIAAIVATVDPDAAVSREQTSPEGVATIAFTDIVGSTDLMEEMGEQPWLELMFEHNRIVQDCVREHGGEIVKSSGDGYMVTFASTAAALGWAISLQRRLAIRNAQRPTTPPLHVRVGLHAGNIFQADQDFLGRAVVLAARITGEATGGQILVSEACRQYTDHQGLWTFTHPEDLRLKGLQSVERVYTLEWIPT
jgi:adenylate cyclase